VLIADDVIATVPLAALVLPRASVRADGFAFVVEIAA
jgi:hypothetical protein